MAEHTYSKYHVSVAIPTSTGPLNVGSDECVETGREIEGDREILTGGECFELN
jgi:hypothetical protein